MCSYDPTNKIVSGLKTRPIYNLNVTLGRVLIERLATFPKRIVQFCHEDQIGVSACAMSMLSIRAAQNLWKYGIDIGDVVGIVGKNTTFLTPIIVGCFIIGAPVNPLDPRFEKNDIIHVFGITKPKIVFCDHEAVSLVKECLWELENPAQIVSLTQKLDNCQFVFDFFDRVSDERSFTFPTLEDNTETVAGIICSSGTTGLSKGVQISHAQLLRFQDMSQFSNGTCFSSLYWLSGFIALSSGLYYGIKRVITHQPFSPRAFIELIENYQIQVAIAAPAHVGLLLQNPGLKLANLSSIRAFLITGGVCQEHLRRQIQEYLLNGIILVIYGMTEVGGSVTSTMPFDKPSLSIGRPAKDIELKIIDDDGNVLGPNQEGEIFIRTGNKFLGYMENEEATREFIDDDGWIHTGDLGYYDETLNFYVVDRKKDTLKYFGYQIAPSEIEAIIEKIKGVELVCVIGIPDLFLNDLVTAVIVKTPGSDLKEEDIFYECADKLPDYKQVRFIFFIDSFEPFMTPSGKIKKRLIKDVAIKMQNHLPETEN